jgi:hypothetical protein
LPARRTHFLHDVRQRTRLLQEGVFFVLVYGFLASPPVTLHNFDEYSGAKYSLSLIAATFVLQIHSMYAASIRLSPVVVADDSSSPYRFRK